MRGGGGCGFSANEYSCAHGAQINFFGDQTPYIFNLCYVVSYREKEAYKYGIFGNMFIIVYISPTPW
jgi:hypothetical protein